MVRSRIFIALALAAMACAEAAGDTWLVEFTSPECGPCRSMRPVISQLSSAGYQVRVVDVSREPQVAADLRVTSWPTFLVLVDGQERARLVGVTTHAQLVEMIHKATELGRPAVRPIAAVRRPEPVTSAPHGGPATFADGSGPQKIVQIQPPTTPGTGPVGSQRPMPASSLGVGVPAVRANQSAEGKLIASTVRLSISDPDGRSSGTGTIVDARRDEALLLTCGHLFRESAGKGDIEITLFVAGPNGAEVRGTVPGILVDYDLDRDLALVRCYPKQPVAVTPIAPAGTRLEPGAPVTSVGCNNGSNPTARQSQITAINRYTGHPNIEAAGAPVEGRSGGGLFNAEGQLVGVCYAADPQGNEGLYASLASIQQKLDSLRLSKVYQEPSGVGAAAHSLASNDAIEVRGQNPTASATSPFEAPTNPPSQVATVNPLESPTSVEDRSDASMGRIPDNALDPREQAALEEIQRRAAGAEVICIIRPRNGEGRSEVIKINEASPALVRALTASAATGPGAR